MFDTLRGLASRWSSAIAGCLCALFLAVTPASAANWATSQVRIVGTRLSVSPANQTVPLNTPTIVGTSLAGSSATLPAEYTVRGLFADEDGHVYPQPIVLRAAPNQPLQIPPLLTAGRYYLREIRLFAGDVPLANYKMIAALAVKRGELQKTDLAKFPVEHGLTGWAPTQGHIPSGVPYIGFARNDIMAGKIKRVMIIGKGSLFLGRMTNLFDGVSFVIEQNTPEKAEAGVSEADVKSMIAKAMKDFAASLMAQAE